MCMSCLLPSERSRGTGSREGDIPVRMEMLWSRGRQRMEAELRGRGWLLIEPA